MCATISALVVWRAVATVLIQKSGSPVVAHSLDACRAAGAAHGQELMPSEMERLITEQGRSPWQRSTTYGAARKSQEQKSFMAVPCSECHTAALAK